MISVGALLPAPIDKHLGTHTDQYKDKSSVNVHKNKLQFFLYISKKFIAHIDRLYGVY